MVIIFIALYVMLKNDLSFKVIFSTLLVNFFFFKVVYNEMGSSIVLNYLAVLSFFRFC